MATPSGAVIEVEQGSKGTRLNYKFQRLRERIREAITSGELSGKLPGERELAKRFKANPKTLSKALTDLAGEGLLDRSIGRGTFIKGSGSAASSPAGRWLILCDSTDAESPLVQELLRCHPDMAVAKAGQEMRPSFINQFSAVIDLTSQANDSFHRSLLVRRIAVMFLNREPALLQLHAVLLDRAHASSNLSRDIFLAGHRRLLVVEPSGDTTVSNAARVAAQRYAVEAEVVSTTIDNLSVITDHESSAILCDGQPLAREIRRIAEEYPALAQVSLAAIGAAAELPFCTGIYTNFSEIALAATNLLTNAQANRPTTIWLTGSYVDRGTIRAVPWQPFVGATRPGPTALSA